jgi:hypothetical protein
MQNHKKTKKGEIPSFWVQNYRFSLKKTVKKLITWGVEFEAHVSKNFWIFIILKKYYHYQFHAHFISVFYLDGWTQYSLEHSQNRFFCLTVFINFSIIILIDISHPMFKMISFPIQSSALIAYFVCVWIIQNSFKNVTRS